MVQHKKTKGSQVCHHIISQLCAKTFWVLWRVTHGAAVAETAEGALENLGGALEGGNGSSRGALEGARSLGRSRGALEGLSRMEQQLGTEDSRVPSQLVPPSSSS
jgi:hypothetical protein